ncbi:MAG: YopT-type cysteine protease domain-containing protein [Planctomycetota bacterium]|jgi:YopT peptidase|nr:YopT-type cysteine protease domain-containing protein [Planctomycetota bacterium]
MNHKQRQMKSRAEGCAGGMTYCFSQGEQLRWGAQDGIDQGKLYKKVTRGSGVMGGACYSIAAFWIVFHATQGSNHPFTQNRSVWDYLFKQGGLQLNAAMNIVVEHRESSRIGQTQYFDATLKKFNIIRRKEIVAGTNMEVAGSAGHLAAGAHRGNAIANAIIEKGEGYRTISLRRATGGGHAAAAWVGTDVCFMDPNFGEFWFPSHAQFRAWFASFWAISNYAYTEIVVRSYSPRA